MGRVVFVPNLGHVTKRKLREMARRAIGDTVYDDLPSQQADEMWKILQNRTPFQTSSSLHITECRYKHLKQVYSVMWEHGCKSDHPASIAVLHKRDWESEEKLRTVHSRINT